MNIFSEIYGTYFRIAAKLLENESTDEKNIRDVIMSEGFRDSVLFLPQKLIPNDGDWGLFRKNSSGKLERITKNPPVNILTILQKRWLKAKLYDSRIRLFLDDESIERLEKRLEGVKPLYKAEHFRFFDSFSDYDDFSDSSYIKNFRIILGAVKRSSIVELNYMTVSGRNVKAPCLPLKLEYSQKNGKFRIYCFLLKKGKISQSVILNTGRIISVKDTGTIFRHDISADEYFEKRKCTEPAVIRVTAERNGIERFMTEFASFEKQTVIDSEKHELIVKLWYDSGDEKEIIINLLSFGPVIEVVSPEILRNEIRKRVCRQYTYNKERN